MAELTGPETLAGHYYLKGSSTALPAGLSWQGDEFSVTDVNGEKIAQFVRGEVHYAPPVADLPPRFEFCDGAIFETLMGAPVGRWLKSTPLSSVQWVARLENSRCAVFVALVLLPLLVMFFVYGVLPFLSELAAREIPQSLLQQLDRQVLGNMDKQWLKPSELGVKQQQRATSAWVDLKGDDRHGKLVFRNSKILGANAFALPGGTIVITDQLLAILKTREELEAVIAHEMGHVKARHGMRNVIQSLGAGALFATVVGDVSWLAESVLVTAPALLQQMQYSRHFEREADQFAIAQLRARHVVSSCLGSALNRIVAHSQKRVQRQETGEGRSAETGEQGNRWDNAIDYLSTHPNIEERIRLSGGTACP